MRVLFCGILAALACLCAAVTAAADAAAASSPIKHVIVLMLENRAFDHMLGFLKKDNPSIDGCLPNLAGCSNPSNPSSPSDSITVNDLAVYQQVSPGHSISATTAQIYPVGQTNTSTFMTGFVKSYSSHFSDPKDGANVMQCFSAEHVPVISTLAKEFAISDAWYSSVPGPTMVNRAYAASATSNGMGTNSVEQIAKGLPQKTMFRQLLEMGLDYRVYFELVPSVLMFKDMRKKEARQKYRVLSRLFDDLASGDMPQFTWVEPSYYDTPFRAASDQHPDHDVSVGEQLVKDVYEALRASPLWNSSALVVTYDEHGGYFDHVYPPTGVPSPDGIDATDDPFDFTRLGVRVPTVFISPFVERGAVLHGASASKQGEAVSQLEHSSIVSTVVHKLFSTKNGLHPQYLTKRDAWARTFESVFSLSQPRADCPDKLPDVPSHRMLFPQTLPALDGQLPLSDLQKELVLMVAGISSDVLSKSLNWEALESWTELQGAQFVEPRVKAFLESEDEN